MTLLTNGQALGQRCSCRSCALRCLLLPTTDWGACYRRPASLTRRAGQRSGRRRRRRTARHRHAQRACSRSSCSCMLFLLRPFRGWCRRLLCSFSSWPYHCRRGWQRWRTPSSWGSRRSLRRPCGLRGGAALILTCAALACIGARFTFLVSMCSTVTLSLVGVRLASLSGLADLVTICWPTSRSLLRFGFGSHFSGAFLCRYIRSLHAMLPQTSLFSFGRASWGPNSPGSGGFMLFLLFLLVQPCQAVSVAPKPRVVEASTTSTGAAQTVSPCVAAVAKPCGPHGLPNEAQKRAFRRARNRVAQAGPDGHTWYRGRRCSAADLGLIRSSSSLTAPLHSTRARNIAKRTSLRVFTCQRGSDRGHVLYVCRVSTARTPLCAFTEPGRAHPTWIRRTVRMATHASGSGSSGCHLPTGNLALGL